MAIFGAATLAAASSHAQSTTQIYGIADLGYEHVQGGGISITRSQFGTVPSRLGYRGAEDLGGGLKAVFNLESGINIDTGSLMNAGRMFGRTSTVGLSSAGYGTITAGRQLTFLFWAMNEADTMGPGAYSSSSLDSYLANIRADNSIAYRGNFGNFTVGALYSLGRDVANTNSPGGTNCPGEVANDSRACRVYSGMLKYDVPAWGAAIGSDRIYGGSNAFGGLNRSSLSDTRVTANGYVRLSNWKLTAGYLYRDNEGDPRKPRSDMWWVGAGYTVGPWLLEAQLFKLDFKNSPDGADLIALRGTYFLSKRTALYATAGHISNSGKSALSVNGFPGIPTVAGASQTGVMTGMRLTF